MPLKIYTSNRMELLVDQLEGVVRQPRPAPATPFTKELIVVQSKGMQRWLSMELARRVGVWANCEFPFPTKIVETLFADLIPGSPAEAPVFTPDVLTWKLLELLEQKAAEPGFEEICGYLADDRAGLKRLQLAERVADSFDRYTVYRPELVLAWEDGLDGGWQGELWRALVAGEPHQHRSRLLAELRQLGSATPSPALARISLIGIPTLPPFHLEVLARVARQAEVNLFLLNPCREYWGHIVSERELARLDKRGAAEEEWYETGNPLLASWGKLGREFFEAIIEDCGDPERADLFEEIPEETLLNRVQRDILDLVEPGAVRREISRDDLSLTVHSCHSPLREVEVLYDTLLSLFEDEPALAPRDVLVMTPDIERFAPYIGAVFGTPENDQVRIPYSIADRSLMNEGETAQALLAILKLCGGRYGVSTVLDILEAAPVARRFGLSGEDLDTVRDWLRAANIRWGIDAAQRGEQGLPPFRENSWQAGLDRLLLGYAMNGEGRRFFNGILPFDDLEGAEALVLGRFISFCEKLFEKTRALARPRSAESWVETLRELLAEFLEVDEAGERELVALSELVGRLGEQAKAGSFAGELSLEVVRYWLTKRLEKAERGFGFLTGGVTFCAMLPMRSIPFQVVALLGMDDGAFPRRNPPRGFDLIAAAPRRGDRSPRDEDRYLFLEALLSARSRLHLSFVGQSIKDNSELPPSVLVSELTDYLARAFRHPDGTPLGAVQRHPLQPFSPRYFNGTPGLFSYSQENFRGALARLAPQRSLPPFLERALPTWPESEQLTLKGLVDFLCNPARELLRRRLGIRVEEGMEPLEEVEPFNLNSLVKYQLEQEIVAALLEGEEAALPFAVACGRGDLPPGVCGQALFESLSGPAVEFTAAVAEASGGTPLPPLDIDLKLGEVRLTGRLGSLRSDRLVLYRYTKLKPKDQLRLWVEHLALNAQGADGYPRSSCFLASDTRVELPPIAQAGELLAELVALYQEGMTQPLHFFPETSLEYAKKSRDPKKAARALADARGKWHGSDFFPGEASDRHIRRFFGDQVPLDAQFMELALRVWGPYLGSQTGRAKRGSAS
ncbi:RecBCD enzyme subunit RecC [Geomonas silvestris]|uniref:RecBCD enzyme subunit RecC n=1 Tax=Geomonas silvestris TaxID=2740184 RepID=A0A6V8MMW2_9BACT|nr:exodeoxyribonuclease V subunit gamma [Geomonas silvestris]GFO60999.1 RecBCD enzyme subunit RecC [Geomonas silvestris]